MVLRSHVKLLIHLSSQVLDNTQTPAVQLCGEYELSEFSRFTRGEYSKFMTMFSKTIAERTKPGQRQSIEEQGMYDLGLPF